MNKNKYFVSIFLAIIIIAPSITFASWWNPFSWFHFSKIEKTETIQVATSTTPLSTTTTTSTPKIITSEEKKLVKITPPAPVQISTPCPAGMVCTPIVPAVIAPVKETFEYKTNANSDSYIDLKVNGQDGPVTVDRGSLVKTSWESSGVVSCSGSTNKKPLYGNETISIDGYTTSPFTIKCLTSNGAIVSDSVVLNIIGPQKADLEVCQKKLGLHGTVMNRKDSTGTWGCICEEGYKAKVTSTTIGKCEKMDYFDYDTYGVFDDGVVYSPEQRAQIECAYYGTGCPTIDVRIINR